MPSNLPVWIIVIGALVAIGIGKMSFGGLGCNIFNPALVGRVFLLISFPVQMTTWPRPLGFAGSYVDASTGATPLAILKEAVKSGTPISQIMSTGEIPGYREWYSGIWEEAWVKWQPWRYSSVLSICCSVKSSAGISP